MAISARASPAPWPVAIVPLFRLSFGQLALTGERNVTLAVANPIRTVLPRKELLMVLKVAVPVALAIALAGCGSFGAIGLPWKRERASGTQHAKAQAGGARAPLDGVRRVRLLGMRDIGEYSWTRELG